MEYRLWIKKISKSNEKGEELGVYVKLSGDKDMIDKLNSEIEDLCNEAGWRIT